jgi:hypothetical protein
MHGNELDIARLRTLSVFQISGSNRMRASIYSADIDIANVLVGT